MKTFNQFVETQSSDWLDYNIAQIILNKMAKWASPQDLTKGINFTFSGNYTDEAFKRAGITDDEFLYAKSKNIIIKSKNGLYKLNRQFFN